MKAKKEVSGADASSAESVGAVSVPDQRLRAVSGRAQSERDVGGRLERRLSQSERPVASRRLSPNSQPLRAAALRSRSLANYLFMITSSHFLAIRLQLQEYCTVCFNSMLKLYCKIWTFYAWSRSNFRFLSFSAIEYILTNLKWNCAHFLLQGFLARRGECQKQ